MFAAIAVKGKEFLYRSSTRVAVPKASAKTILEVLNKTGYRLRDGEVWHLYDTEVGEEMMAGRARLLKGRDVRIKWEAPL